MIEITEVAILSFFALVMYCISQIFTKQRSVSIAITLIVIGCINATMLYSN